MTVRPGLPKLIATDLDGTLVRSDDSVSAYSREVLDFGDMPNALPLFGWAGWGRVAVGNAHEEIRAVADEVIGANDEDGVASYLDRLLSAR